MSDNKKSATKFPPDWEKNVQRMWRILREYDSNIPSDDLDLMRQILLDAKSPSQAQQEPSKDMHEAITLLSAVFDAWENGTDCYDDFDGVSGSFIGKAFNLDDEIFKRCCDLLNRVNPPRNVSQAQQPTELSKQLREYAAAWMEAAPEEEKP